MIDFELQGGGKKSWYGTLKQGKGRDFTMGVILTAGLDTAACLLGPDKTTLEVVDAREVELVIETETYEGKNRQKIKYVNEIGGSSFRQLLSKGEAVEVMEGIDLKGELMAAKMAKNAMSDSGFEKEEALF